MEGSSERRSDAVCALCNKSDYSDSCHFGKFVAVANWAETIPSVSIDEIAEKAAVKESQESALNAALTKQRAGAEALLQARAEDKDLTAVLTEKKTQVIDGETAYKALEGELLSRRSEVKFHEKVQGKLTELLERQSPADSEVAMGEEAQE